jgi:hypothetical protein
MIELDGETYVFATGADFEHHEVLGRIVIGEAGDAREREGEADTCAHFRSCGPAFVEMMPLADSQPGRRISDSPGHPSGKAPNFGQGSLDVLVPLVSADRKWPSERDVQLFGCRQESL